MLTLHAIQARHGDCLILQFGTPPEPRYILIDGGPASSFDDHLRHELQRIGQIGAKLELAILSHVDTDHITGLLDLVAELRRQQADGEPPLVTIDALWHNSFSATIDGEGDGDRRDGGDGAGNGNGGGDLIAGSDGDGIAARFQSLMATAGAASASMAAAGIALAGIGDGNSLRLAALAHDVPINPGLGRDLISVEELPEPVVLGNLSLRVVGPTARNLAELKREWLAWLGEHEVAIATGDPQALAMADRSIPNLSSIMLLAAADGKTILFTGDGRGDHLLAGLDQAGLLDGAGRLSVDVLKVPHHGSNRNVTKAFFEKVVADTYVLSADGKYGNPDLDTLEWIVDSAHEQGRRIEIVATNATSATRDLVAARDPVTCGYRLTVMPTGSHALALVLAD